MLANGRGPEFGAALERQHQMVKHLKLDVLAVSHKNVVLMSSRTSWHFVKGTFQLIRQKVLIRKNSGKGTSI